MPEPPVVVPELAQFGENIQNRTGPEPILENSPLKWPSVQGDKLGRPVKCTLRKLGQKNYSMPPDSLSGPGITHGEL